MPTIQLKRKSPEFEDSKAENIRFCDNPSCTLEAEFKAPKSRNLDDYYWFCVEHIKEYNSQWNFFQGMNDEEILNHMEKSRYGDRPTWKSDFTFSEESLKEKVWSEFRAYDYTKKEQNTKKRKLEGNYEEVEAMAIMGLEPPINIDILKKKYKELAKKFHPDKNSGCKDAEEKLKKINISYNILKKAYERFEKIKDK